MNPNHGKIVISLLSFLASTWKVSREACGLPARNLLLDAGAIKIEQKVWHGKIETVKSKKGNRLC